MLDLEPVKQALQELLEGPTDVALAEKWGGGMLVLQPRDTGLKSHEIPIDSLFHKVVMIRDRLRTLEQKLNSHPKFSDAEKVEMQQYITRCYGTLTSFNILFRDPDERFIGEKSGG